MNIYPSVEQRFSPFEFYSFMRKNNPVAFDEQNEQWVLYRYKDIEKIEIYKPVLLKDLKNKIESVLVN